MDIKRIGSVLKPGVFLTFDSGQLSAKPTGANTVLQEADWVLEPLSLKNTYRIRHRRQADHYLHVETGPLACEPIDFGANSSYWIIEPLDTYETFTLRNFWRTNFYIYTDGDQVAAGAVAPKTPGAHWYIEDAGINHLLVPVHLDALWLPHDQAVLEPIADFSRLPYFDGQRDINSDTVNISEEIMTPPLQPPQLYLKAGLHLHWALPDALHNGVQLKTLPQSSDDQHTYHPFGADADEEASGSRLHFIKAPDRWLVTRTEAGARTQWVVESNYLHPPGDGQAKAAVTYPYRDSSHPEPFRYLGRKVPLVEWSEADPQGTNPDYLHDLTAVGYGEPTFSAFFPNCHSVFGFYDEASAGKSIQDMQGVQYEVIGWHSAAGSDVLEDPRFQEKVDELRVGHQASLATAPYKFEALKTALGWIAEGVDKAAFPRATVYFARLALAAASVPDPGERPLKAAIAIGNSATEALAAHLGVEIGGANARLVEEQVEALYLLPELEGQQLDTGPKFREARHLEGFKAVHGGLAFTFRPASPAAGEADAQSAPYEGRVTLPDELALDLDRLNDACLLYHQAKNQLESRQEQLFSDWYKYMLTAYPPDDAHDDYPDMDMVAWFITQHSLRELDDLRKEKDRRWNQLQETGITFAGAIDALQRILVADIRDWDAFLGWLNGRDKPQNDAFRLLGEQIKNALSAPVQAWLTDYTTQTPVADGEKEKLLTEINTFLASDPVSLVSGDLLPLLLPEARELQAKGNASLTPPERRRLGRLVLECALPRTLARRPRYVVEPGPAPRYFQPTEPVVLLADSELKLTDRHGEDGRLRDDGLLACFLFAQPSDTENPSLDVSNLIEGIRNRLDQLQAMPAAEKDDAGRIGFYTWREQPWHPFMLEWEVELFPLEENGSHAALDRQYKPDFIHTHYDFPEDGPDFIPKKDGSELTRSANIYSGRSLMLDYAQPQLIARLEAYCAKYLAPLYYVANKTPPAERQNTPPLDQLIAWAKENKGSLSVFNQAVIDIRAHLAQNPTPPIAQVLSGFNAALLQHKQTLQFPVDDPLGFPEAKKLAETVREGLGRASLRAPQPLNDFNPLRTGALHLQRLRLVDTFGRIQTFLDDHTPQSLVPSAAFERLDRYAVLLPPRLVQPARLRADWLAARPTPQGTEMKMNVHPATSPICGWLVPNYLDNNLLVYNQAGQPLGALQRYEDRIIWLVSPGREPSTLEAGITNPHLYKLVSYFLAHDGNFLDDVLTAVESALENIMPAGSAEHDALALLVGRPLAVVRASVGLEVKGFPASNQDWNLFRQTLQTFKRPSDNFTGVAFPMRVGEHSRLDDGLLGFWIENPDSDGPGKPYLDNKFYLPQTPDTPRTGSIDHPDLIMHRGGVTPHIQLALDTPEQTLTMLVDPRGAVHISSGILPVHSLRLPPDHYLPALRDLEMTFFSGPFLTKTGGIELPLPAEPGFSWSLLTSESGVWADTHAIDPVESNATFDSSHMIREGWLKLKKEAVETKKS